MIKTAGIKMRERAHDDSVLMTVLHPFRGNGGYYLKGIRSSFFGYDVKEMSLYDLVALVGYLDEQLDFVTEYLLGTKQRSLLSRLWRKHTFKERSGADEYWQEVPFSSGKYIVNDFDEMATTQHERG